MYKKHQDKYNNMSTRAIDTIKTKFDVSYNTDSIAHTIRQSKIEYEKRMERHK
jgi:transposase